MNAAPEKPVGVYVHVPYCRLVCPYCDFVKRGAKNGIPGEFIDALCAEIAAYQGPRHATSVFFGGGTPSMLTAPQLKRILHVLGGSFDWENPEISLETNPDDVSAESARGWHAAGVTRLSLGVQSFDDEALAYLGRIHDASRAREACETVAAEFDAWGIDLIFGAGSTEGWTDSLRECRRFDPPHVSTYGLTYEQGTPFWRRRDEAMEDDASLELYRRGMDTLDSWEHYEVSNFAKAGCACKHNELYWRNESYAGFGPGAYSYLDEKRERNLSNIAHYIERPLEREEVLTLTTGEQKIETLIQHFRTSRGLTTSYYEDRFAARLENDFGHALALLMDRGLVERTADTYKPTRTGYELNDEIGLVLVP